MCNPSRRTTDPTFVIWTEAEPEEIPAMSYNSRSQDALEGTVCRAGLLTLLVVQLILGYEWFVSGVTKIASGTFVSGLADNLRSNADSAPGFYRSLIHSTLIPNARTLAVLIEIGELLVGIALIAAAIVWLTRWARLPDRARTALLGTTMLAALGATFMAINFHLARGGNHPWLIPADGMDETIDVDIVLVFTQLTILAFSAYVLLKIRREQQAVAVPAEAHHGVIPSA
jgi:uncharacterized membrane protein YphA (DoxX/SURF4 family)